MIGRGKLLMVVAVLIAGCRTAHDVAVTSYHEAIAPVNLAPGSEMAARTRPTAASTRQHPAPAAASSRPGESERSRHLSREANARATPRPSPVARATPAAPQFPTAKPVEGKPGYVYSPSDPTKYVDVSGYAPGSKVKDPYSGKIFLVP
jgi:hypothetical protein